MTLLPRSLLARIMLLHVLAVVATAVCLSFFVDITANRTATQLQKRALRDHAMNVVQHLKLRPDGTIQANLPPDMQTLFATPDGRFALVAYDESGRELLSLGRSSPAAPDANRAVSDESYSGNLEAEQSVYSGLFPVRIGNRNVYVRLSENLGHRDALLDDMARTVAWPIIVAMGLLLTTLVLANIFIVRWATAPLETAASDARAIGPSNLDVRLSAPDAPQEVQPLVTAFNVALDRLEEGFRLQKEFTADAAHELRTPLAVLRARVETMSPDASKAELIADIETMTRTLNQLLAAAQLEQTETDDSDQCDIADVAAQEVANLAPLAIAAGKTIDLNIPDAAVIVRGSTQSHSWALRNLLDNALRHTPENTSVEVFVSADGSVTVCDRGPGIPEADRQKIFQRFWRGDRRNSQHAGLGLSIVHRAVTTNGGTITVADREGGGAVFRMRLMRPSETGQAH